MVVVKSEMSVYIFLIISFIINYKMKVVIIILVSWIIGMISCIVWAILVKHIFSIPVVGALNAQKQVKTHS